MTDPALVKPGSGTAIATVTPEMTAKAMGSGSLDVFATPAMAALMEQAVCAALVATLPEGQTTVGTEIDIEHLAPSPVGARITATATLTSVNGRTLRFSVAVRDGDTLIGKGHHTRAIVDAERFMRRAGVAAD